MYLNEDRYPREEELGQSRGFVEVFKLLNFLLGLRL